MALPLIFQDVILNINELKRYVFGRYIFIERYWYRMKYNNFKGLKALTAQFKVLGLIVVLLVNCKIGVKGYLLKIQN